MTGTATHRPLAEPFDTGASWLARAVMVSAVVHVLVAGVWWMVTDEDERRVELVDIELAPPPPKAEALPAEIAKRPEASPAAQAAQPTEPEQPSEELALADAGVPDAPIDAPPKKKRRKPDAGVDEEPLVADLDDAGAGDASEGGDAGEQIAMTDPGLGGAGAGAGAGSESGVPGALTDAPGDAGVPGMDTQPAVEGAPTNAGTAANLLAYFPQGHQITVLIRFDRLRKTEWKDPATRLFKPMPDYQALFGRKDSPLADNLDTLVISSPRPQDATATTLVAHTQMTRPQMRTFLSNPDTPIRWSATKGGMFGVRSGKLFPKDRRVLLSPWRGWFVLAQPEDLGGVTTAATGSLDTIEAKAKLPPWLAGVRKIEDETNDAKDPARGPALVLTLKGPGKRYTIPDVGIGVTTAPSPERLSLAMELVKQGWLVRGNIVFANESDAAEFVQTVSDVQQRITDSRILSGLLKKQHAFNAVAGLSVARTGARVSYATSISIADARALLAAAAQTLDAYFANPP